MKCHLAGIAGWEQGGCGRRRGAKCFLIFWSSLATGLLVLRLVTEVFYWSCSLKPQVSPRQCRHTPCTHLTSPLALPWQFQEEITAGQSNTSAGKQMSNETDGIILYAPRWQSVSIYAHMHAHIGMYRLFGVKSMTWSRSRSLPGAVHATTTSPWDGWGDEPCLLGTWLWTLLEVLWWIKVLCKLQCHVVLLPVGLRLLQRRTH